MFPCANCSEPVRVAVKYAVLECKHVVHPDCGPRCLVCSKKPKSKPKRKPKEKPEEMYLLPFPFDRRVPPSWSEPHVDSEGYVIVGDGKKYTAAEYERTKKLHV